MQAYTKKEGMKSRDKEKIWKKYARILAHPNWQFDKIYQRRGGKMRTKQKKINKEQECNKLRKLVDEYVENSQQVWEIGKKTTSTLSMMHDKNSIA